MLDFMQAGLSLFELAACIWTDITSFLAVLAYALMICLVPVGAFVQTPAALLQQCHEQ